MTAAQNPMSIGRILAIGAELFVFLTTGAAALSCGGACVVEIIRGPADWGTIFFLVLISAAATSFARRAFRAVRRVARREEAPVSFFSLEWNSAFSFFLLVAISGILASLAVPQRDRVVELGRVEEARKFILALATAQDAEFSQRGHFTANVAKLKRLPAPLRCFDLAPLVVVEMPSPRWTVRLTRNDQCLTGEYSRRRYGHYQLVFDSVAKRFDCAGEKQAACRSDLLR